MIHLVFESLKSLFNSVPEEDVHRILRAASKLVISAGDVILGGGITEVLKENDPDKYTQAEKLNLSVAELEALTSALTRDVNRLQNELNNLSDPSLYIDTEVHDALGKLGFVNSRQIKDQLSKSYRDRVSGKTKEVKAAHDKYESRKSGIMDKLNSKESELADANAKLARKRAELDIEQSKTTATKVFE